MSVTANDSNYNKKIGEKQKHITQIYVREMHTFYNFTQWRAEKIF